MTATDRAAHRYAISRMAFAFFFICVGVLLTTIFQGLTS